MPARSLAWDALRHPTTTRLTPALPLRSLVVPRDVELIGESLWVSDNPRTAVSRPVTQTLLDVFVRLETADEIRVFAARWGVLNVCRHQRPFSWHADCGENRATRVLNAPRRRALLFEEPIWIWKQRIEIARAILRMAVACREGALASPEDDGCLLSFRAGKNAKHDLQAIRRMFHPAGPRLDEGMRKQDFVAWQRRRLTDSLNLWSVSAEIHPALVWRGEVPEIEFFSAAGVEVDGEVSISLIGALGLQLLFAVAAREGVTTCSGCGMPFFAARKRADSRDKYCPTCGRTAAMRAAKQRYRARQSKTVKRGRGGRAN